MNKQLTADIMKYRHSAALYEEFIKSASANNKQERRVLFSAKIEAAENVLMNVQNYFGETMKKMGIYDLYTECTSGKSTVPLLFKLADETSKLL